MATTKTHLPTTLPEPAPAKAGSQGTTSIFDRGLRLLSSVRFGIIMLLLLGCCMLGMLVMQQNVEGFRAYYAKLTPATRSLYESLSFFNIYHSWYFTALLAITALNIILSSLDRFPSAWAYVSKPKLTASPRFVGAQAFRQTVSRPGDAAAKDELALVAGHRVTLKAFEKVSRGHTLTVQYDPGRTPVYLGFGLLTLSLCMVFFYSHQRVWAVVEPDGRHTNIYFGGNTNRNRPAFEARFGSLIQSAIGGSEQ